MTDYLGEMPARRRAWHRAVSSYEAAHQMHHDNDMHTHKGMNHLTTPKVGEKCLYCGERVVEEAPEYECRDCGATLPTTGKCPHCVGGYADRQPGPCSTTEDSMDQPKDIMRDGQHFNPEGAWEKSFLRWLDGNPVTQRPELQPFKVGGDGIVLDDRAPASTDTTGEGQ